MCPVHAHPRFESPIRLAPGFDPEALPDLFPPVRGVRPWTWLADPETPDVARSRYLARHVRGHGTVDDPARELALVPRSRDEVVAGYLNQQVFFEFPDAPGVRARLSAAPGEVRVEPAPGKDSTPGGGVAFAVGFPFAGPIAIVGTTPPAGAAASVVGRRLGEELADLLAGRGSSRGRRSPWTRSASGWITCCWWPARTPGRCSPPRPCTCSHSCRCGGPIPQRRRDSSRWWTSLTRCALKSSLGAWPIFGALFCGPAR